MQLIGIILTVLLALTMLPAAGFQSAYADEPAERPATTGGDAALEGYASETAPVAQTREDGMYMADGLVYTVADGGLSLVGFDGLDDDVKEIVVPEAISVDGKDTAVVSVAIAEGNVAEGVVFLTLPQSINDVDTATLATAFPSLASVEVAAPKASAPVAAGAAAMKAAYSSFGGVLYKNNLVTSESGASQTTCTKELVWAPSATVVVRIPAECTSIAAGAFADVEDLKTVVCFGVMEDIPQAQKAEDGTVSAGAFTDEQIATVDVIVPQTGTVVTDDDRVSADVAVTDVSTMDVKREAWWKAGFASDRITLGEVYGSTTKALPVTEEGVLETAEAEVAYAPETTQNSSSRKAGIEPPESAIPTPVPDDDQIDPSESGLVFTHLADMTLSVSWKGDPTATPSHIDIPAYATINGVTYPVTKVAPHAFEGAVFLTSVTIPDGVTVIGDAAFAGCANLADVLFPAALRNAGVGAFNGSGVPTMLPSSVSGQKIALATESDSDALLQDIVSSEAAPSMIEDASLLLNDSISDYIAVNPASSFSLLLYTPQDASDLITIDADGAPACLVRWLMNGRTVSFVAEAGVVGGFSLYSRADSNTKIAFYSPQGACCGMVNIVTKSGFMTTGVSVIDRTFINGTGTIQTSSNDVRGFLDIVRNEAAGKLELETVSGAASKYQLRGAYAAENHAHDGRYYTESEIDTKLNAKLDSDAVSNYNTNAKIETKFNTKLDSSAVSSYNTNAKLDAKFNAKVNASEFGSITYSGLDGADSSVYPATYRQGGSPAIPAPKRAGAVFDGWTWSRGGASGSSSNIADAFSEAGDVTLTANWKAASTGYFFSTEAPFDKDGGEQSFTLAVRLSDSAGTLSSASFENDNDALFPDGAGVAFAVGNALGADGTLASAQMTADGFSAASGSPVALARLGEQSWGVYVRVTVSGDAAGEVTKSFADGSYVAKFVKLNYGLS